MNDWDQLYMSAQGLGPLLQMLYDLSARVDQIDDAVSPNSPTQFKELKGVRKSLRNTQARIRRVEFVAQELNQEVSEFEEENRSLRILNETLREKLGLLQEENEDLREELATFQQREIERLSCSNEDLKEHLELKSDGVYGRFKGLNL